MLFFPINPRVLMCLFCKINYYSAIIHNLYEIFLQNNREPVFFLQYRACAPPVARWFVASGKKPAEERNNRAIASFYRWLQYRLLSGAGPNTR